MPLCAVPVWIHQLWPWPSKKSFVDCAADFGNSACRNALPEGNGVDGLLGGSAAIRIQDARGRQPEGRGAQSRLVRPGSESEDPILLRALRNRDSAHEAENSQAQREDRGRREARPIQWA